MLASLGSIAASAISKLQALFYMNTLTRTVQSLKRETGAVISELLYPVTGNNYLYGAKGFKGTSAFKFFFLEQLSTGYYNAYSLDDQLNKTLICSDIVLGTTWYNYPGCFARTIAVNEAADLLITPNSTFLQYCKISDGTLLYQKSRPSSRHTWCRVYTNPYNVDMTLVHLHYYYNESDADHLYLSKNDATLLTLVGGFALTFSLSNFADTDSAYYMNGKILYKVSLINGVTIAKDLAAIVFSGCAALTISKGYLYLLTYSAWFYKVIKIRLSDYAVISETTVYTCDSGYASTYSAEETSIDIAEDDSFIIRFAVLKMSAPNDFKSIYVNYKPGVGTFSKELSTIPDSATQAKLLYSYLVVNPIE